MSRIIILFFSVLFFTANAQTGYQIRIKTEKIQADSLVVKEYNFKSKKFTPFQSLKFQNDITIKDKTPLKAGIYVVEADSTILTEFLISDEKNQKFTITLGENDIKVEGSKENNANREYMKQMFAYNSQLRILDEEARRIQQKRISNAEMIVLMDSIREIAEIIFANKKAYQEKMVEENKGFLLASIIQSSMDALQPPQEVLRDRMKLFTYLAEHHFDNFPWQDDRLLNTPVLYNKFKSFGQQIFPLDAEFSTPIVLKILNESKINRSMYIALFDYIEHDFGSYRSPYRDDLLYIAMLKDILKLPDLDETRKLFYEYELNLLSKNQAGMQAEDFNILWANGDTTTMYDIEAELLLLYFQHPDCPTCKELREKLKDMEILNNGIASGKIKVVTIYFEGNGDLWRNYLQTRALKNWEHGWNFDESITEKRLYDIRNIPMIMFLDKNKKVIKKDLLSNDIEEWLKYHLH
jgi:thiol-disulfide isomerase/thioredoxin